MSWGQKEVDGLGRVGGLMGVALLRSECGLWRVGGPK